MFIGTVLAGLLFGELLVRIQMLINVLYSLVCTGCFSCKYVTRIVINIFSNEHKQIWSTFALAVISIEMVETSGIGSFLSLTFVEEFLPFSFVWFLIRESNAFDNLVDENKNLRDLNAELGDFMALSYWLKFLHPFVAGNIKQKMSQHLAGEYDANYKCFQKLIILLPSSCDLHLDENHLEKEDVFKHLEHCSDDCESAHSIEFPSTCHGYSDIHQTMHWIYRDTKEETHNRNEKILVMFHFPQIIRSMMGPGRDWEEKKRPGGRQRNVEQMKEKLVDLLLSNGYGDMKSI